MTTPHMQHISFTPLTDKDDTIIGLENDASMMAMPCSGAERPLEEPCDCA